MSGKYALLALLAVIASGTITASAQEDPDILVDVGSSALWIEFAEGKAFVANPDDSAIVVIDIESGEVTEVYDAVEGISVLEIIDEKNIIYATAFDSSPVYMFALDTGRMLGTIDVGEEEITLSSTSDQLYGQREYVTFSTNTVGLAYNSNTELLYAVLSTVDKVAVIDTRTNEKTAEIHVGQGPLLMVIDEARNNGYVTNMESGNISVIDLNTNSVKDSLQTGFAANQMRIDEAGDTLYVTHQASSHVTAVNLATQEIAEKIQLGGPTHALELDETSGLLHVTYLPESATTGPGASGKVEFINTRTNEKVGTLDLPENPFTIKIHEDSNTLFASILNQGTVVIAPLEDVPEYQDVLSGLSSEEAAAPGGGCLVATAAYGTELAPQVQMLREVRDGIVMSTESGSSFVEAFNDAYYAFSPAVADLEREHPAFRDIVRVMITPMVASLGIMSLAEEGSEAQVLGLGISVIALNLGMYVAAPALAGLVIYRRA